MNLKQIAKETLQNLLSHWITGLIIAALALSIPYWGRLTDSWSWPTVVVAVIALIAASLVIYRNWWARDFVKTAELSLRIHADARQLSNISSQNIGRWYLLKGIGMSDVNGTLVRQVIHTQLFITFRPWVLVGTLDVQGRNMVLPHFTTPKVDSDAVIIVFDGELPAGELEIRMA